VIHALFEYGKFAMWFAIAANLLYLTVFLLAAVNGGAHARLSKHPITSGQDDHVLPPISILVPAYNEAVTVETTVRNLLALQYPRFEVLVVSDGSTDDTVGVLRRAFDMDRIRRQAVQAAVPATPATAVYKSRTSPNLTVIDKPNSGKGDTLNTAINFASSPLVTAIDADTLLDPDALYQIAQAYLQDPTRTAVLGGHIRVGNGCQVAAGRIVKTGVPKALLARCQLVEYTKAFVGGRTGWSAFNGLLIVSGAFGVFRRDVLAAVGGYTPDGPGEDTELILRIHKYMRQHRLPYRVVFCPQAVSWTQAPESLRMLGSQRRRWSKGDIQNMWRYRFMFMNPRYAFVGLISVPYTVLVEMVNPYILTTGVASIVALMLLRGPNVHQLLWLLALNLGLDYALGFGSLMLDDMARHTYSFRDLVKIGGTALHMPLWYYYMSNYWRMMGHIQYFTKNQGWGQMTRQAWTTGDASQGGMSDGA
jgi:poly-beta-1,6-N-acetyl-D-glucosamine synthase